MNMWCNRDTLFPDTMSSGLACIVSRLRIAATALFSANSAKIFIRIRVIAITLYPVYCFCLYVVDKHYCCFLSGGKIEHRTWNRAD